MASTDTHRLPHNGHSSTPGYSGTRFVTDAGLVIAQLGVAATSVVIWFGANLHFFGETADRGDYRDMTIGFALGAALLLVGLVPAHLVRASTWVLALGVLLALGCAVAAVVSFDAMPAAQPYDSYDEPYWPLMATVCIPTAWPMLAYLLASPFLVRGRSAR